MSNQESSFKPLPIKFRGMKVGEITKVKNNNGYYTHDEMKRIASYFSKTLNEKGFRGKIMTCIYIENLGWRSARMVDIGEIPPLFSLEDYDLDEGVYNVHPSSKIFKMYIMKESERPRTGRTANKSDCFYQCLAEAIPRENMPFKSGKDVSDFLKVSEYTGVHIDDIPKIEKKLKVYRINVHGDHKYISTHPGKIDINLNLIDGHYTLRKPKQQKSHVVTNKRKIPLIYEIDHSNETVKCCTFYDYDKRITTYFDMPYDYFKEVKANPKKYEFKHNMPYVFIQFNKKRTLTDSNFNMEKHLIEYTNQANIISFETGHELDLLRTYNYKNGALDYFYKLNAHINPEPIEAEEVEYIYKASIGALIWYEDYKGELFSFDVVSHYPNIMRETWMRFPIKKGEFHFISELEKGIKAGIYRCKITDIDERLFKLNPLNYYTHIDLNRARDLNATIELIKDDKPNFLYYPPESMISGAIIFKPYVERMFQLKNKKIEGAKSLLNILWGALSEKKIKREYFYDDKEITIPDDNEIIAIQPKTNKKYLINHYNPSCFYKTNWARIAPFIISKGRSVLSKIMEPHIDYIKRVHTDGFLSTKQLNIKTGNNIGDLKYEGYYKEGKIINCLKVEGEYTKI